MQLGVYFRVGAKLQERGPPGSTFPTPALKLKFCNYFLITYPHVVPNLYDLLSTAENKK